MNSSKNSYINFRNDLNRNEGEDRFWNFPKMFFDLKKVKRREKNKKIEIAVNKRLRGQGGLQLFAYYIFISLSGHFRA